MASNCSFLCLLFSNWALPRKPWFPVFDCFDSGIVNSLISWTNIFPFDSLPHLPQTNKHNGFHGFYVREMPMLMRALTIDIEMVLFPCITLGHIQAGTQREATAESVTCRSTSCFPTPDNHICFSDWLLPVGLLGIKNLSVSVSLCFPVFQS